MSKTGSAFIFTYIFFVLIAFSVFLIGSLFLKTHRKNETIKDEKVTHPYHMYSVDPETGISTTGHVRIFDQLEEDESIFYIEEKTNHHTLISHVLSSRYKCTGDCVCEEEDEKRRTAHSSTLVLRKTLFYLVSAVTAMKAFESAQNYFEDECEKVCSDEFGNSAVRTEVEECEDLKEKAEWDKREEDLANWRQKPVTKATFFCEGCCIPRLFVRPENVEVSNRYGCEKLEFRAKFPIEVGSVDEDKVHTAARMKFQMYFLDQYCIDNSKDEEREPKPFSYCDGGGEVYFEDDLNPSIFCTDIREL